MTHHHHLQDRGTTTQKAEVTQANLNNLNQMILFTCATTTAHGSVLQLHFFQGSHWPTRPPVINPHPSVLYTPVHHHHLACLHWFPVQDWLMFYMTGLGLRAEVSDQLYLCKTNCCDMTAVSLFILMYHGFIMLFDICLYLQCPLLLISDSWNRYKKKFYNENKLPL